MPAGWPCESENRGDTIYFFPLSFPPKFATHTLPAATVDQAMEWVGATPNLDQLGANVPTIPKMELAIYGN